MRLSEREAILLALANPSSELGAPQQPSESKLSVREREVAALLAAGLANKQVASRLNIAERTVDAHVEHIRSKLQVHSRAQIAIWAMENGLVPAMPSAATNA